MWQDTGPEGGTSDYSFHFLAVVEELKSPFRLAMSPPVCECVQVQCMLGTHIANTNVIKPQESI